MDKTTFDTLDLETVIQKLHPYGIRGAANNWFSKYIQSRLHYVSISGFNSDFEYIHCGARKGSNSRTSILFYLYSVLILQIMQIF